MPVEQVAVPKAGESITEATLNRWFKPDGSFVKADEPLFEMGTDKASQEVVAPVAGLALASRPTYSKGKFIARSRGSTNDHPPMFCDSSCTHTHSRHRR